jgi:hypothetical protein
MERELKKIIEKALKKLGIEGIEVEFYDPHAEPVEA